MTLIVKNVGIQPNTTASSPVSIALDNAVNQATNLLLKEPEFSGFWRTKKLEKKDIAGNCGACQPDGGIIHYRDQIVMAVEAKSQKNEGNAIERSGKNRDLFRFASPAGSYVYFACGEGTIKDGIVYNYAVQEFFKEIINEVPENLFNRFNPFLTSIYLMPTMVSVDIIMDNLRQGLRFIRDNFDLFEKTNEVGLIQRDLIRSINNRKKLLLNTSIDYRQKFLNEMELVGNTYTNLTTMFE